MVMVMAALPLFADEGGGEAVQPSIFGGGFLPMMIFMVVVFYFFIMRPERKRQKKQQDEREKMLSALKKGDKIVTIGGIHGVIQSVKESTCVIKSGDNAVLEITKAAVQNLAVEAKDKEAVKGTEEQVKEKA